MLHRTKKRWFLIFLSAFQIILAQQGNDSIRIAPTIRTFNQVKNEIERSTNYKVFVKEQITGHNQLNIPKETTSIRRLVEIIAQQSNFSYYILNGNIYLFEGDAPSRTIAVKTNSEQYDFADENAQDQQKENTSEKYIEGEKVVEPD